MRIAMVLVSGSLVGCGLTGSSLDLPLISPPVRAATPKGLEAAGAHVSAFDATDLSPSDLHDRFFSGDGPTDLMTVMGWIDERIGEINGEGAAGCLATPPVATSIDTAGITMALPAQCYRRWDDDAFMQFAVVDGVTSVYVTGGAVRMAAILTPVGATDYTVDAYYGVGYTNATSCGSTGTFDGCSYGVTSLHASSASKEFEMSVAGIGEGYCGVQLRSDGMSLYAIGSTDMGMTCREPATLCVDAADLTVAGTTCGGLEPTLRAIGRKAGAGAHEFGASTYPAEPNVTLDGTGTDSLHFGPTAPSAGVAEL